MARLTVWLNDSEKYASVEAEEMHEDDGFLKAYSAHNELVAIFDLKCVKGAYISKERAFQ